MFTPLGAAVGSLNCGDVQPVMSRGQSPIWVRMDIQMD